MARTNNQLYFAPELRFSDLDLTGARLPDQFRQRIDGFYLKPAMALARAGHAFAAGVIVVCAIDALALLKTSSTSVSGRITALCMSIPDLAIGDNAELFCAHFRHGLVHEARIKNGSEFSVDIQRVAISHHGRLVVNPLLLARSVVDLIDGYIAHLNRSPNDKKGFLKRVKSKFKHELQGG